MVSRQERRRNEKKRMKGLELSSKLQEEASKGIKPIPLCPFDNNPCQRPRSPIDGDLQCGGIQYQDGETLKEIDLMPPCERLDLDQL